MLPSRHWNVNRPWDQAWSAQQRTLPSFFFQTTHLIRTATTMFSLQSKITIIRSTKIQQPENDLLNILSVADDLDAFGYTGIYRYSEIYLTRGISPKEIGNLIRENASRRYHNFEKIFGFC